MWHQWKHPCSVTSQLLHQKWSLRLNDQPSDSYNTWCGLYHTPHGAVVDESGMMVYRLTWGTKKIWRKTCTVILLVTALCYGMTFKRCHMLQIIIVLNTSPYTTFFMTPEVYLLSSLSFRHITLTTISTKCMWIRIHGDPDKKWDWKRVQEITYRHK